MNEEYHTSLDDKTIFISIFFQIRNEEKDLGFLLGIRIIKIHGEKRTDLNKI